MVIVRAENVRKMDPGERAEKIEELKTELLKEEGKVAVGGFPENPGRIKELKRTIARIKTIQHEEERDRSS